MNLNKISCQKYKVFEQNEYKSSPTLEFLMSVKSAFQIYHEKHQLDGAYLAHFGIDVISSSSFMSSCRKALDNLVTFNDSHQDPIFINWTTSTIIQNIEFQHKHPKKVK